MNKKIKQRKNSMIQTRLTTEEHERFVGHVSAVNKSVAEVLREAVSFYMDHLAAVEKKPLLALNYDEDVEERRTPRHLWGS